MRSYNWLHVIQYDSMVGYTGDSRDLFDAMDRGDLLISG